MNGVEVMWGLCLPDETPPHLLPLTDPRALRELHDAEALDRLNGIVQTNGAAAERPSDDDHPAEAPTAVEFSVVPLEEFVEVDEPGADALVGEGPDAALIPEGGDVMFYGDGGAGKTTLSIDLAFHLAAGEDWLGIPVARAVNVLLIENEGPRPMFRQKLRRKLQTWTGRAVHGRIRVVERPWGGFTFASDQWREELALKVTAWEIDVVIAGPLTRIGMDEAGTLQQTAAFMELVHDVRRQSGRALTVILIHHENKSGAVSGAWEGAGDTLLHTEAAGNGHTILHIQKARWDPGRHKTTLRLAWANGDGFELEGDRDRLAEIKTLLSDGKPRIVKEIAAPEDRGGIGANADEIKALLDGHPELFETVTGDAAVALGRHRKAILWKRTQTPKSVESVGVSQRGETGTDSRTPPLRESVTLSTPAAGGRERTQTPKSVPSQERLR